MLTRIPCNFELKEPLSAPAPSPKENFAGCLWEVDTKVQDDMRKEAQLIFVGKGSLAG